MTETENIDQYWECSRKCFSAFLKGDAADFWKYFQEALNNQYRFPTILIFLFLLLVRRRDADSAKEKDETLAETTKPLVLWLREMLQGMEWEQLIFAFLNEEIQAGQLAAAAGADPLRRCQMHFYIGARLDADGDRYGAHREFRLCHRFDVKARERNLAVFLLCAVEIPFSIPGTRMRGAMKVSPEFEDNFKDPLITLEQSLQEQQKAGDGTEEADRNLAQLHYILAFIYASRGAEEKARENFQISTRIFKALTTAQDRLTLADHLFQYAEFENETSHYKNAAGLYLEVIEIVEQNQPEPTTELTALFVKGAHALGVIGRREEAEKLYKKALKIEADLIGENDIGYARTLDMLGHLYCRQGTYAEAERLYKQAATVFFREREMHPWDYSVNTLALGDLYVETGRIADGEVLIEKALDIRRQLFHDSDTRVAIAASKLAAAYTARGRYEDAETLLRQVLAVRAVHDGEFGQEYLTSLNELANVYIQMGRPASAIPLFEEIVKIIQVRKEDRSVSHAILMLNLAQGLLLVGDIKTALEYCEQALTMLDETVSKDSEPYAHALLTRGECEARQDNYALALENYHQAVAILNQSEQVDSQYVLHVRKKMSDLYYRAGQPDHAELILEEIQGLCRLNLEHPFQVETLRSRAAAAYAQGKLLEASSLLSQALQRISERSQHQRAIINGDLGNIHATRGDNIQALACHQIARSLLTDIGGPDNPDLITTLGNLATIETDAGHLASARSNIDEAARIYRKVHEDEATLSIFLIRTQATLDYLDGNTEKALRQLIQAEDQETKWIEESTTIASRLQRLNILEGARLRFERLLTLFTDHFTDSTEFKQQVFDIVLHRKGLDAEIFSAQRDAVMSGRYPHLREKFSALEGLRTKIASHRMTGLRVAPSLGEKNRVKTWVKECGELEEELAQEVSELRLSRLLRGLRSDTLGSYLPAGSVLVEWLRFRSKRPGPENKDHSSEPEDKYLAFIIRQSASHSLSCLVLEKSATDIDALISEYRSRIHEISAAEVAMGKELRRAVWDPLAEYFKGAELIYMCPDSLLSLLPFASLPNEEGTRLIDDFQIHYLPSARNLARLDFPIELGTEPVLVGNPRFDWSDGEAPATNGSSAYADLDFAATRGTADIFDLYPLHGSEEEAKDIAVLLGISEPWIGEKALKSRVLKLKGPRILLFATHAYDLTGFLPRNQRRTRANRSVPELLEGLDSIRGEFILSLADESPLSLVGLALAGAETFIRGQELPPLECQNGLLSGEEATGLDLTGCELCVLSTCDSGLGTVKRGEGVFSLAYAFTLAGARSVVQSLWKQNDEASSILMKRFFELMKKEALSREAALRRAQRELRALEKFKHPYFWAGWACYGQTGPLNLLWTDSEQPPQTSVAERRVADGSDSAAPDPSSTAAWSFTGHRPPATPGDLEHQHIPLEAGAQVQTENARPTWEQIESAVMALRDAHFMKDALALLSEEVERGIPLHDQHKAQILEAHLRIGLGEAPELSEKLLAAAEQKAVGKHKAWIAYERGNLHLMKGEEDAALASMRESSKMFRDLGGEADKNYLGSVIELSRLLHELSRNDEAESLLIELLRGVDEGKNIDRHLRAAHDLLVRIYLSQRNYQAAESVVRKLISSTNTPSTRADDYFWLAVILREAGREQEALEAAGKALEESKKRHGYHSKEYAAALHEHGAAMMSQQRREDAAKVFQESLEIQRSIGLKEHRNYVATQQFLAVAFAELGQYPEAIRELEAALRILDESLGGDNHPLYWQVREKIGELIEMSGDLQSALKHLNEVLVHKEKKYGHSDRRLLSTLRGIMYCLQALKEHQLFEQCARRQIEISDANFGVDNEDRPALLNFLAGALLGQKRLEEGEEIVSEALELARRHGPKSNLQILQSLILKAQVQSTRGTPEAAETAREGLALLEETLAPSDQNYQLAKAAFEGILKSDGPPTAELT